MANVIINVPNWTDRANLEAELIITDFKPKSSLNHPYAPHHLEAVNFYNGKYVTKEAKEVLTSGNNGYHAIKSAQDNYPVEQFKKWMAGNLKILITSLLTEQRKGGLPQYQLVLLFGTHQLENVLMQINQEDFNSELPEIMGIVSKVTVYSSPSVVSFFEGIIGNANIIGGHQTTHALENGILPCISTLAIPAAPGLFTSRFVITRDQEKQFKQLSSATIFRKLLGITDVIHENLKGIFLLRNEPAEKCFYPDYRDDDIIEELDSYLMDYPHVALAGGIKSKVVARGVKDADVVASGFLVYGRNDNVRVTCALFDKPLYTRNSKDKILKLQNSIMKQSDDVGNFGIMITSAQRGTNIYGRPGVEANHFNELLPTTALIGGTCDTQISREIFRHYTKMVGIGKGEVTTSRNATLLMIVSYKSKFIYDE